MKGKIQQVKVHYRLGSEAGGCKNNITHPMARDLCDRDPECQGFYSYLGEPEMLARIGTNMLPSGYRDGKS